jgi:hypothetical protein
MSRAYTSCSRDKKYMYNFDGENHLKYGYKEDSERDGSSNVKLDFGEIGFEDGKRMELAQDRIRYWISLLLAMIFAYSYQEDSAV